MTRIVGFDAYQRLRYAQHQTQLFLSVLVPRDLWAASVNDAGILRGDTVIAFNGGAGLDFSAIEEIQEVWIGSSPGGEDIGRARIRSISSGDGGVTGTLTVADNPLLWVDGANITFKHDYPLRPKYPYIDLAEIFYKDGDIVYTDQNLLPPPVVLAGPHLAEFFDGSGSATFDFELGNSYAVTQGATISTYSASVYPLTGVVSLTINPATGVGSLVANQALQYWVKFTIVDSNGKSQSSYRCYFAHDPAPSSSGYPITNFSTSIEGTWDGAGWSAGLKMNAAFNKATIPDGTLAILWQLPYFDGAPITSNTMSRFEPSAYNLVTGYIRNDTQNMDLQAGVKGIDFTLTTPEGRLRNMYDFSVSLRAVANPIYWYQYAPWLTIGRALHHLWKWHSTLFEVCDVAGLLDNTYGRVYAGFSDGNLYDMANSYALNTGIRAKVVSDKGGVIYLSPEIQLLTDSQRAALIVALDIQMLDRSATHTIVDRPENRSPFVTASGFSFFGAFEADGETPIAFSHCAIAPGAKPTYDGPSPSSLDKQTVSSQSEMNEIAGRFFAQQNNHSPEYRVSFHGNYLMIFDPAYTEWWTTSLNTTETSRGISWSTKRLILRRVSGEYDNLTGFMRTSAIFEPEQDGNIGIETDCEGLPADAGGEESPIPAPEDIGDALATTSHTNSVYLKGLTTTNWDLRRVLNSWDGAADPFWRITQGTYASSSAIIWRSGDGNIERTTDAGLTWQNVTPLVDPPNDAVDFPVPVVANLDFITFDVSYINNQQFLFGARWQNISGTWRSWLARTDDNGSTYEWISLDTLAASGTITPEVGQVFEAAITSSSGMAGIALNSECVIAMRATSTATDGSLFLMSVDLTNTTFVEDTLSLGARSFQDIFQLDSRRFIAIVKSITADTIRYVEVSTDCTTLTSLSTASVQGTDPANITVAQIIGAPTSPTEMIIVFRDTKLPGVGLYTVKVEIIAGTLTVGGTITAIEPDGNANLYSMAALDATRAVYFFQRSSNNRPAVQCVSLGTPYFGALVELDTNTMSAASNRGDPQIVAIDTSIALVVWHSVAGLRARAFSCTGTTIVSVGPLLSITVGISDPSATLLEDGRVMVTCNNAANALAVTLSVDTFSLLITQEANNVTFETTGWTLSGVFRVNPLLAAAVYFHGMTSDNKIIFLDFDGGVNVGGVDGYEYKINGISIGKNPGETAWVTAWTGSENIMLRNYDLSPLVRGDSHILTASTLAEFDFRQKIAFPSTDWISDNDVAVFGLMIDPDTGGRYQIRYSTDGYLSTTDLINNWGLDFAGAMVVSPNGIITVLRHKYSSSKIYQGTISGISLVSAPPIPSGTSYHGLAFDFNTGIIYLGADIANAIMVVQSAPPYSTWANITYNHGTTRGITSVILL